MPTRIAFSTHFPDRMGDLAGKPTRFPEKLITMIDPGGQNKEVNDIIYAIEKSGVHNFNFKVNYSPKTTTIRKNYEYWKSKEGQLIQPFFWAGKPRRSNQVVFCPEVRLARVDRVFVNSENKHLATGDENEYLRRFYVTEADLKEVCLSEGFDNPDHFWMWFDQDYDGALLELESV